jgi:soluble lytic murein transglycosylase-like protein
MAEEELDENEKAALDIWRQRMSDEPNLPANWREGIYRGMVERLRVEKPGLRSLPTDLVMRMMFAESSYDPSKIGSAGEIGLMQVKPRTAEEIMHKQGMGQEDLADPRENILTGMSYLQSLSKQLGGVAPAVEAYNVGPGDYKKGKRNPSYVRKVLTRGIQ